LNLKKTNKKKIIDYEKPRKKGKLRENIEAIIIAIILALIIRTFIVQAFKIPSGSMKPTLLIGDHILVNKFIYGVKIPVLGNTIISVNKPVRGDIIVFKYPEEPDKDFIKRVIGIPGDSIIIKNKKIFINNNALNQDYGMYTDPYIQPVQTSTRDNYGPVTIPDNSYFVMGDNRDNSLDSRFWGFVDEQAIKGKAFIIYWSWDSDAFGVRWKRIGNLLK